MIVAALALFLAAPAPVPTLPDCTRLSAGQDGQDGAFDGMSHSGVLLTLRNDGPRACRTPGLPMVTFLTRGGRRLDIARRAPVGMHPGPVVVPVALAPGETASTALRWVSGNVFDNGRCLSPAKVSIQAGGRRLLLPFRGSLCGALGEPVAFDQPVMTAPHTEGAASR